MKQDFKILILCIAIASLIPIGLALAIITEQPYYLIVCAIGVIIIAAGG